MISCLSVKLPAKKVYDSGIESLGCTHIREDLSGSKDDVVQRVLLKCAGTGVKVIVCQSTTETLTAAELKKEIDDGDAFKGTFLTYCTEAINCPDCAGKPGFLVESVNGEVVGKVLSYLIKGDCKAIDA